MSCVRIIGKDNNIYRKVADYCVLEETNQCCILCSYCQNSYETENLFWIHIREEHNFALPPIGNAEVQDTNSTCGDSKGFSQLSCVQEQVESYDLAVTKFIQELVEMLEQQTQISDALTLFECENKPSPRKDMKENEGGHLAAICQSENDNKACELETCISNLETEIYKDDINGSDLVPFIKEIEDQIVRTTFRFSFDTIARNDIRCNSINLNQQPSTYTFQNNNKINQIDPRIYNRNYKPLNNNMEVESLAFATQALNFETTNVTSQNTVEEPKALNEQLDFDFINFTNQCNIYETNDLDQEIGVKTLASTKQAEAYEIQNSKSQLIIEDITYSSNQTEVQNGKQTGIIIKDETIKPSDVSVQHSEVANYCGVIQAQNEETICSLVTATNHNNLKEENMFEANTNVQRASNGKNIANNAVSKNLSKEETLKNLFQEIQDSNNSMNLIHAFKKIHQKYNELQAILHANPIESINQILSAIPTVPLETTYEVLALDRNIRTIKSLHDIFYDESLLIVAAEPDLFVIIIWKLIMTDETASSFSWYGESDKYVKKYPIKDMAIFEALQAVFRQKFPKESTDYFKQHTISYFKGKHESIKRKLTETFLMREIELNRSKRLAIKAERKTGS
ncbi:uncharacterized protein LOC119670103 [Teleopsis dalmanni]|uniref:uncharacterized protein LOC119670103 n=1 Tax=Teleopsis dalmanni TaxID=139649 RepID=UPI0018CE77F5|nr:uncharacterized protein LOC119670103 [Teleopsis dalmanni]